MSAPGPAWASTSEGQRGQNTSSSHETPLSPPPAQSYPQGSATGKWRGQSERRQSEDFLIEQFINSLTNSLEAGPTVSLETIESGEEVHVSKVVEDVVDAPMGSGREVALHKFVHQVLALMQELGEHIPVEGVFHLIEADDGHGGLVQLLSELLHDGHLLRVELVMTVEDRDFDRHLNQVLHDLISFLVIVCVFPGHFVELIEDIIAGIIDQLVGHSLAGNFAENLLLDLEGKALGTESNGTCGKEREKLQKYETHLWHF